MSHGPSIRALAHVLMMLLVTAVTGCVERVLVVRSDPPNARVFVDGHEVGEAPYTESFVHYGTREVTVRADGFVQRTELVELTTPWWQVPPIDFLTEVMLPWNERDEHEVFLHLDPISDAATDLDATLIRARDLKQRSQAAR
ncbi:MAG: PEGA domain-containing protein [Planctomycetota bacterium]